MDPHTDWVNDFCDAVMSSVQKHDVNAHMPFNGYGFYPMFADLWVAKVVDAIHVFNERGLRMNDVIERMPNQSSMKFKFVELLIFCRMAETSVEDVRTIADFFHAAIRERVVGEPLWLNNKVHAFEDVTRVAKEKQFVEASREQASEIGKIITGCATLAHGLYNDFCTDLGYDAYGPYSTESLYGPDTSLVIKSFGDLDPTPLWSGHAPFPYKKVQVYSVYRGVNMTPTYIPCQMLYKESLPDNLIYFQVEANGQFINKVEDLKPMRDTLLKAASDLYVEFMQLGFEKQKELWLYQLGYQMKQFFDIVGVDWKPSAEMIDRVKSKPLDPFITAYDIPKEEFYDKFGLALLKNSYKLS